MNKYFILILIVNLIVGVALVYPLFFLRTISSVTKPVKQKVIYKLEISLLLKTLFLFMILFVYGLMVGCGLISFNDDNLKAFLSIILLLVIFN